MSVPVAHTLPKAERLCGVKNIAALLKRGRYGNVSCLRYCYAVGNGTGCNRILISVPKKQFKRAVQRNLIKRRIRESYRLQKEKLPVGKEGTDVMFIYTAPAILPFAPIFAAVGTILENLHADGTE